MVEYIVAPATFDTVVWLKYVSDSYLTIFLSLNYVSSFLSIIMPWLGGGAVEGKFPGDDLKLLR